MRGLRKVILVLAAVGLVGCGASAKVNAPASQEPLKIAAKTWDAYQQYLAVIGSTGHGVFAVVNDGDGGASWVCETAICKDNGQFATKAIARCETINPGYTCIVFAIDVEPQVPFEAPTLGH